MFTCELIVKEDKLKMEIQAEILRMLEDLKASQDVGYTSWVIAENIVSKLKS